MERKNKKLLLFDIDGTLINTVPFYNKMIKYVAEKVLNIKMSKQTAERTQQALGLPFHNLIAFVFQNEDLTEEKIKQINKIWCSKEKEEGIPPIKNSIETVKKAKEKHITGVLTSRQDLVYECLKPFNPQKNFDIIIQGIKGKISKNAKPIIKRHFIVRHEKPDPNVLKPALELSREKGIDKKKIVLVEDSTHGIQTAINAKIDYFAVCTGTISRNDWINFGIRRDKILNDVSEIQGKL